MHSAVGTTADIKGLIGKKTQAFDAKQMTVVPGFTDCHNHAGGDTLLYEVLVPASQGPQVWDRLLEEGAPLHIACVGLEAIEHLTATRRLHDIGQPAAD